MAGTYAPGHRLVEAALTAEFATSRGVVREALRRLAGSASPCVLRGRRMLDCPLRRGRSRGRRLAGVSGAAGPGHCRRSADSHSLERG
jgi:hypothetical protein